MKSKRSNIKSRRGKDTRRQQRKSKKKLIITTSAILVIIATFLYVMNHSFFAVNSISVQGQKTLLEDDIVRSVRTITSGRRLGLVRRDNVLLVNTKRIAEKLRAQYPKIQEINVAVEDGEEIIVILGERSAHSLWCINQPYESYYDEECYYSDRDGLLYARAPYFSGSVYRKIFVEPKEDSDYIGMNISAVENFEDFFAFIDTVESSFSLRTGNIFIDNYNDVRLEILRLEDIRYNAPLPVIIYNQSDDYDIVRRNIGITLDFDTFKKAFTAEPKELTSIDVRFDGRIFFSFAQEEEVDQTLE